MSRLGVAIAALSCAPLLGYQSYQGGIIMAAGNRRVNDINAAPGQIITVLARVDKRIDNEIRSPAGLPVPELMGIGLVWGRLVTPIFSLRPSFSCLSADATRAECAQLVTITAQIPNDAFECGNLRLKVDGKEVDLFKSCVVSDQIKILGPNCGSLDAFECMPAIFHADGTEVTQRRPALPGEKLVVYAVGLGRVGFGNEYLPTGVPAPPGAVIDPRRMVLEFSPNAGVRNRAFETRVVSPALLNLDADFMGPVTGFVGLYQVNITLPANPPVGMLLCSGNIDSNATLSIFGASADAVGFCVAPVN